MPWRFGRLFDVPAGNRFRHEMRLVPGMQLVAEVFHVALDGAGRDAELLRALFRGQSPGNALQDLSLPF
jgi:hypothetical protein